MDKQENFRDNLLRADGIKPEDVSSGELERFQRLLTSRTIPQSRVRIMARPITRLAAAIAIASLVVAGIYFFGAGTNHVWAQVLDKVKNANSFQYLVTGVVRITDQNEPRVVKTNTITYISDKYGVATEHYAEGKLVARNYLLFDSNEQVSIDYIAKECQRSRSSQTREDLSQALDPKKLVIKVLGGEYSELGRRTVNGRTLAGIETHDSSVLFGYPAGYDEFALRVWVDAETKLPVRTETEIALTNGGQTTKRRYVADQFLWDLELPAALFVPRIPEGYTVWTGKLDETACVNGFRLFAESTGGLYPSKLDDETFMQALKDVAPEQRASSEDRQMADGAYRRDRAWDTLRFYQALAEDSHTVAYYGDRVTPADTDSVLMYWDVSDTEWRVVWADLRLETMSVVELADHFFANEQAPQLVDLLETAPYEAQETIATYLAPIAGTSAIVPLQRCVERWQGADNENPFENAIAEIWRRVRPSDAPLVKGRVVYANGRPPRWAAVQIGNATCLTASDGYFAMAGPSGAPQDRHLCCVLSSSTHTGRAFFWSATQSDRSMTIVLDFTCMVHGRIVDTNRAPLPQANVKLISRPEKGTGTVWALPNRARIDADGHFVFEEVPVGVSLELVAEISGLAASQRCIMVGELVADQDYDMADVVLNGSREENFNERP